MDAGDSTRLFLRGELCLEMENMVYLFMLITVMPCRPAGCRA